MSQFLYHCFPGFLSASHHISAQDTTSLERLRCQIGFLTLKSILEAGLLLTPELFSIPNPEPLHIRNHFGLRDSVSFDPNREKHDKFRMQQIRACFTLATASELKRRNSGLRYSSSHFEDSRINPLSHFDLFGDFAIGLDPIEARALGAIPTIYYYVIDPEISLSNFGTSYSLSFELVCRLLEARKLLIALAHVEALADSDCADTATIENLKEMGQNLDDEPEPVVQAALSLNYDLARKIYPLFDTNRVPIANIVEHIELFLNFFQVADSHTRNRSLAYFQQKEWRIVQHNKEGLTCEPIFGTWPSLASNRRELNQLCLYWDRINNLLRDHGLNTRKMNENYWLLINLHGLRFSDYIRRIIVPDSVFEPINELVDEIYSQRSLSRTSVPEVIPHSQIMEE